MFSFPLLALLAVPLIRVETPMTPPEWAYAERALLKESVDAAVEFAAKYTDSRGHFRAVERWGGNDGPDDVTETFHNWPLAFALGADGRIMQLWDRIWEGHLDQYQKARAPSTRMAAKGMYWREFPVSFDWEHNGEGLAPFYHFGLSRPGDRLYRQRAVRFARFYTGDDPEAPNYDKQHKIIRSLHNGSRGPLLETASVLDWGGETEPGMDRHSRYETAGNIRGDHPLNLCATTLGMTAYLLTSDTKYKDWVMEYTTAWRDRILSNGGNVPTNIGLDGKIGGEWGGKWYGGTFGWNFWPQSNSRNYYMRGVRLAMGSAFLLTHDLSYLEPLRKQLDNLYAVKKEEKGRVLLPNKHGDQGCQHEPAHLHWGTPLYLWCKPPPAALSPATLKPLDVGQATMRLGVSVRWRRSETGMSRAPAGDRPPASGIYCGTKRVGLAPVRWGKMCATFVGCWGLGRRGQCGDRRRAPPPFLAKTELPFCTHPDCTHAFPDSCCHPKEVHP